MKYSFLFSLLLACTIARSQTSRDSAVYFFYVGAGYQYQAFTQLSNRIGTRAEYMRPGSSYSSVAIGLNKEVHHFTEDVNFHFSNNIKGDDEKKSSSVMGFGTAVTVGYNFSKKANFRFYPFIGISGEIYRAQFNKDVSAISFDSILVSNTVQQRTEPVVFTNNLFCYQGGIAFDYVNTKYRLLHSIGIRASYTGGFKSHSWRVNENQLITNAPTDKVSQFNISLLLGVGRKRLNRM